MSKFDGLSDRTHFLVFFPSTDLLLCPDTLDIRKYFHRDDNQSKQTCSLAGVRVGSVRHPNLRYTLHHPPLSCRSPLLLTVSFALSKKQLDGFHITRHARYCLHACPTSLRVDPRSTLITEMILASVKRGWAFKFQPLVFAHEYSKARGGSTPDKIQTQPWEITV
jgi:hypothetical protein